MSETNNERETFEAWVTNHAFNIKFYGLAYEYAWSAWQTRAAIPPVSAPAVDAAISTVNKTKIANPTNRYLFAQMCDFFGIELGRDSVSEALSKIAALRAAPPIPAVVDAARKFDHPGCDCCACPKGVCQAERASVSQDAAGKPLAWVRFRSDGGYEGPIMDSDSRMDGVRRSCGAWTPLYTAPAIPVADARANSSCPFCDSKHDGNSCVEAYRQRTAKAPTAQRTDAGPTDIDIAKIWAHADDTSDEAGAIAFARKVLEAAQDGEGKS